MLPQPERIDEVWRDAFAATCPVIINAIVDPEEPPLPTSRQRHMPVLWPGSHRRGARSLQAMRAKVEGFVPAR